MYSIASSIARKSIIRMSRIRLAGRHFIFYPYHAAFTFVRIIITACFLVAHAFFVFFIAIVLAFARPHWYRAFWLVCRALFGTALARAVSYNTCRFC